MTFSRSVALLFTLCVTLFAAHSAPAYGALTATAIETRKQLPLADRSGPRLPLAGFRLRGANGYRVSIGGSSKGVFLIASHGQEGAFYLDRGGHAGMLGIQARFGGLGVVSLRFHPEERSAGQNNATKCRKNTQGYLGTFRGSINLRGEHNFLAIRQRSVRGAVISRLGSGCSTGKDETTNDKRPSPRLTALKTTFPPQGPRILGLDIFNGAMKSDSLQDTQSRRKDSAVPSEGVTFLAELIEDRGRLLVMRKVATRGKSSTFKMIDNGTVAHVDPPYPFGGTAEFKGCAPIRNLWRGSLRVRFPGTGMVRLAGKDFSAYLKREVRCPEPVSAPPPRALMGSSIEASRSALHLLLSQ